MHSALQIGTNSGPQTTIAVGLMLLAHLNG